jgi:hypothetical protein
MSSVFREQKTLRRRNKIFSSGKTMLLHIFLKHKVKTLYINYWMHHGVQR